MVGYLNNLGQDIDTETTLKVRELITQIEDKGYYNKEERDILNGVRNFWFESKYKGKWVCRYCFCNLLKMLNTIILVEPTI